LQCLTTSLEYGDAANDKERAIPMPHFYLYFFFLLLLVSSNERKRRQMKPRVLLEPDAFNKLVKTEQRQVIRTAKMLLHGHMYVTEGESYYYYTYSKEPFALPEGIEVIDAKLINF